jgi:hypothetical protein
MNNKPLDAAPFNYSVIFHNTEFEQILAGIIACYYCIVNENIPLPPNNENEIRNIMLSEDKYLKNTNFRAKHPPLDKYQFDPETVEGNGRADIRILSVNPYEGDRAYYIIECKRINDENQTGVRGLNGEYIREGIIRFTSRKYPFYKKTAGMIGFVIANMNIKQNINFINELLKSFPETNTQQVLVERPIVHDFECSYYSIHKVGDEVKCIYHLMFDFSRNIRVSVP